MIRLSACCSSACAHQPMTRAAAKVGVNKSRGKPHRSITTAGVPLDVGVQLLIGLQLGQRLFDLGFNLHREIDQLAADLLRDAAQHVERGSAVL